MISCYENHKILNDNDKCYAYNLFLVVYRQRSRYSDWLRAGRPRIRSSSQKEGQKFSLLHSVQTGSEAHPASYPMGTGGSFPGGKAAAAWGWPLTSN
jgi:hypothetical protein